LRNILGRLSRISSVFYSCFSYVFLLSSGGVLFGSISSLGWVLSQCILGHRGGYLFLLPYAPSTRGGGGGSFLVLCVRFLSFMLFFPMFISLSSSSTIPGAE